MTDMVPDIILAYV